MLVATVTQRIERLHGFSRLLVDVFDLSLHLLDPIFNAADVMEIHQTSRGRTPGLFILLLVLAAVSVLKQCDPFAQHLTRLVLPLRLGVKLTDPLFQLHHTNLLVAYLPQLARLIIEFSLQRVLAVIGFGHLTVEVVNTRLRLFNILKSCVHVLKNF